MPTIKLIKHAAFPWKCINDKIYIRGYFYNKTAEEIGIEMSQISMSDIKNYVRSIKGCFSIVYIVDNHTAACVSDISRSFPLFYKTDGSIITDSLVDQSNESDVTNIDNTELASFLLRRNTSASRTLLKMYNSVNNSEIVYIQGEIITKERYYVHSISGNNTNVEELVNQFNIMFQNVMNRMILSVNNEQKFIIPLSGGYDSRLIITKLCDMGLTDRIIAYTYGIPGDYEVINAKNVADKLGVKWYFCNYTEKEWENALVEEKSKLLQYIDYSFNYASLPHLQDYIAIKILSEKKIISSKDIIVPGYCADFQAGSFIPSNQKLLLSSRLVAEFCYSKHFINTTCSRKVKEKIINELESEFNNVLITRGGFDEGEREYEQWCIDTRITTWVLNSLRIFEFFGYEWRLPFWDAEFLQFWYGIDNSLRKDCTLYKNILFNGLFKKHEVAFEKPKSAEVVAKQNILKSSMRKIMIWFSFFSGKLLYKRNNTNNYNVASMLLFKDLKSHSLVNYETMSLHSIEMLWLCDRFFGTELCKSILRGV